MLVGGKGNWSMEHMLRGTFCGSDNCGGKVERVHGAQAPWYFLWISGYDAVIGFGQPGAFHAPMYDVPP